MAGRHGTMAGMERRRFQFSLDRLLLSITCFASAAAIIGINVNRPDRSNDWGGVLLLMISIPAVTTCIGAGVGAILGRLWWGSAVGFVGGLAYLWAIDFI